MNLTVPELEGLNWQDKLAYLVYQFSQIPDQIDCPVAHSFVGESYIREMRIPAGTLFIGRPHTHGHLVQLVEGSVVVHTHAWRPGERPLHSSSPASPDTRRYSPQLPMWSDAQCTQTLTSYAMFRF
jgi:hypothetical protein